MDCTASFCSLLQHPSLDQDPLDTRINYGLNWIFACKWGFTRPQLFPLITACRLLYSRSLLPILLSSSQSQLLKNCFCRRRKSGAFRFILTVFTANFLFFRWHKHFVAERSQATAPYFLTTHGIIWVTQPCLLWTPGIVSVAWKRMEREAHQLYDPTLLLLNSPLQNFQTSTWDVVITQYFILWLSAPIHQCKDGWIMKQGVATIDDQFFSKFWTRFKLAAYVFVPFTVYQVLFRIFMASRCFSGEVMV